MKKRALDLQTYQIMDKSKNVGRDGNDFESERREREGAGVVK